jgi:hypothetical protein
LDWFAFGSFGLVRSVSSRYAVRSFVGSVGSPRFILGSWFTLSPVRSRWFYITVAAAVGSVRFFSIRCARGLFCCSFHRAGRLLRTFQRRLGGRWTVVSTVVAFIDNISRRRCLYMTLAVYAFASPRVCLCRRVLASLSLPTIAAVRDVYHSASFPVRLVKHACLPVVRYQRHGVLRISTGATARRFAVAPRSSLLLSRLPRYFSAAPGCTY